MAARTAHPPTLADVAAHIGVSRTTVSNAYNRPDQLSPALRGPAAGLQRPRSDGALAAPRTRGIARAGLRPPPPVHLQRPGRRALPLRRRRGLRGPGHRPGA